MPKNHEDEEYDHEDQWSNSSLDGEETNKTENTKIAPCGGLSQCPSVDQSFRVDLGVEDEEQIVAISQID